MSWFLFRNVQVAQNSAEALNHFVGKLMQRYLMCVEERSTVEAKENAKKSCNALIEGLDRFHRRLQSLSQLVPGTDFGRFVKFEFVYHFRSFKLSVFC